MARRSRPRIRVVRTLADEYQATLIQADRAFQKAAKAVAALDLADDGVHPSLIGHRLLASEWLTAVGLRTARSA
jgi:acyl-CoA thioesterase-1